MSAEKHPVPDQPDTDLRRTGLLGLAGFFLLFVVLGGWAATTVIGGAVVANGQAVVHGKPQVVQSLDGGVVAEIHAKSGDVVAENALLVRLDSTLLEVNLGIAQTRLAAALPRQARLRAEQLGLLKPIFDYPALPFAAPDTTDTAAREAAIFATRAATLEGQRAQLAEALQQYDSQRSGVERQITAIRDQIVYVDADLENLRQLSEKGLTRASQVTQTRRARAQLAGELAGLETELARIATAGRDARLELQQAERAFHEAVITELREVTAQVEQLTLEIVTHTAQLERVDIRAPAGGIVHEMQIATKGGVIAPGATILEVIPLDQGMDFELRVDPRSVDQVHPGQTAQVILSSYDPQNMPQIHGAVTSVSAAAVTDPQTGEAFYRVGLEVPPEQLARAGEIELIPGMPVEAFLQTDERTVLAYLMHPVTTHLNRAFRE